MADVWTAHIFQFICYLLLLLAILRGGPQEERGPWPTYPHSTPDRVQVSAYRQEKTKKKRISRRN